MRLRRITVDQLCRILERQGWQVVRQRGSHRVFRRPDHQGRAVVPVHAGKTLAPKTLAAILKSVDISPEEFNDML